MPTCAKATPAPKADFERLRAFIHWPAGQRVAPGAVGQSHLEAYLAEREASSGGSKQVSQPPWRIRKPPAPDTIRAHRGGR